MKAPLEPSKLLDRGKPTVRELLSSLVFNPVDGTIRLNGDRIVMQRAAVGVELRRELTRLLGPQEARVFLMRLGFLSGQADARFVRTNWPNVDIGDAFTAGTRLHTFSGVVRVETVYNDFDFRKKRFSAEFLWHDSVEAAEFRRRHRTTEPACWTQLGYACGYASEFFDTLIIYKEVECAAQGHRHCKVVGKPADVWGPGDPEVILFRERIMAPQEGSLSEPLRRVAARTAESALSELDRLVLAPVRAELDRLAPMALPVMITGSPGTGRSRAARYLHRASGGSGTEPRHVFGNRVDLDLCAEIARRGKGGRRGPGSETVLIDAAEQIPSDVQPHLARAIEDGMVVGGPRIVALVGYDPSSGPLGPPPLSSELWYALSALAVRMPTLGEREGQRLAIARTLLPVLAARMGIEPPRLDGPAGKAIERATWPGNLRQMRTVLSAVLAAHRDGQAVSRAEIEAQLLRFPFTAMAAGDDPQSRLRPLVDQLLAEGDFSLSELERSAYKAAVDRARGNLSAAARLLGLTRAQLAYRLGAGGGPAAV
ncbi:XylR N-terminal domain-containing protein [Mesorhizobium sp. L-8-3]|uniref:XylR N-terminal domain-containing protein n=1 Tax=Mesorhizobium sp. L-8-3 TaxID=2744522 RepID=UPI00192831CD|nr:XylR N-terminal domain-containing protein [Mesorhizobium sp. L-8-3]